jgi:Tfp pilus assembly protein PilN
MAQLHLQKTAEAKKRAAPARVFERPCGPAIAVVVVLALSSAFGHQLSSQARGIIAKIAEQQNVRLSAWGNKRPQDKTQNHKHLMDDVIKELRQQQDEHARLSNAEGANATGSRALSLKSVIAQGESIAIEGMATTPNAVAEMISDLRSTGYFRDIEITETYQDDSKNKTHAFTFQLTCEVETDRS